MKILKAIWESGILTTGLVLLCSLSLLLEEFSPKANEKDVLIDLGFLLVAIYAAVSNKG